MGETEAGSLPGEALGLSLPPLPAPRASGSPLPARIAIPSVPAGRGRGRDRGNPSSILGQESSGGSRGGGGGRGLTASARLPRAPPCLQLGGWGSSRDVRGPCQTLCAIHAHTRDPFTRAGCPRSSPTPAQSSAVGFLAVSSPSTLHILIPRSQIVSYLTACLVVYLSFMCPLLLKRSPSALSSLSSLSTLSPASCCFCPISLFSTHGV